MSAVPDIELLRLQYEILNMPLAYIAQRMEIPISLLEEKAKQENWQTLWPDEEEAPLEIDEDEDAFVVKSDAYVEKTKKRLIAFALAKELLLTQKYLQLEKSIIDKALDAIDAVNYDAPNAINTLAGIYTSMSRGLLSARASSEGKPDSKSDIPMVILRDLSGSSKR